MRAGRDGYQKYRQNQRAVFTNVHASPGVFVQATL